MTSTLRNDTSRAVFLSRLGGAWDKEPSLTFLQLLASALGEPELGMDEHGVRLDNERVALAVEKFVLLGREPEPTTRPDRERPR